MRLLFNREVIGSTAKLVLELTEGMELDMFSLNLINHNEIAYLAPVELVQYDTVNYLQFDVTGKNTLSNRLSEVLGRNEVMRMLGSIINAFEEMDAYMLPESGALLDFEYVFVDEQDRCTFLYIPFRAEQSADRILFLQGLTESIRPDYSDKNPYFFNILNSFSRGAVKQIGDFKEILRRNSMEAAPEVRKQPEIQMPSVVKEQHEAQMPPVVKVQPKSEEAAPVVEQSEEKEKPVGISFAIPGKAENVSMNIPQADKRVASREEKKADKKKETKKKETKKKEAKKEIKLFGKKEKSSGVEATKKTVAAVIQESEQPCVREDMYESYEKTVMMSQPAGPEVTVHIAAAPVVELVRKRNGENLQIMKERVILGSGSEADCRIDGNKAVSRKHAFLFARDNTYYITDNNSSNGTWVNGSRLMPGMETEISSGALIRLANEDFEFRLHV